MPQKEKEDQAAFLKSAAEYIRQLQVRQCANEARDVFMLSSFSLHFAWMCHLILMVSPCHSSAAQFSLLEAEVHAFIL